MTQEFIPYEQALALKELGFDEPCVGVYMQKELRIVHLESTPTQLDYIILTPLYQQAFRWFREKHSLIGLVEGGYADGKNIFTYIIWNGFIDDLWNDYVSTYEQAELECLKKLIEIVKK